MLVSSERSDLMEKRLQHSGLELVKVQDGESAIQRVHRAMFDLIVVASTGSVMDTAETVLNLKDIRPRTEIVIIQDSPGSEAEVISRAFPNTRAMTLNELTAYLGEAQR
jgi:PleD family two-component response regulator